MDACVDKFVSRADTVACLLLRTYVTGYVTVAMKPFDRCDSLTISLSRYALNVMSVFCERLSIEVFAGGYSLR